MGVIIGVIVGYVMGTRSGDQGLTELKNAWNTIRSSEEARDIVAGGLSMAAGFGLGGAESYPGVFCAFGGFADDAKVEGGAITLSDRPGIGFEGQAALYTIMRELAA